jgi:hypothetical protein
MLLLNMNGAPELADTPQKVQSVTHHDSANDISALLRTTSPLLASSTVVGAPGTHVDHMWLKLALLPILDFYSLGLLWRLVSHPIICMLFIFFTLFVNRDVR